MISGTGLKGWDNFDPNEKISSTIPQFPAYFFIQPVQQDLSLDCNVKVRENQIIVDIQQGNRNTSTEGALMINRMGYIYIALRA